MTMNFRLHKKIKKILKYKKEIFLFFLLIFLLIPRGVSADLQDTWEEIKNTLKQIGKTVVSLPLNLPITMATLWLLQFFAFPYFLGMFFYVVVTGLAWLIMNWSIRVPVSPSNASLSPPIRAGWNFSLGFVNMFFILILTFVGLAIILRIKDYEGKKVLPKILAMAIIINFIPVIVGFIVDVSNIFTRAFISQLSGFGGEDVVEGLLSALGIDNIVAFVENTLKLAPKELLNAAIQLILQFFFYTIYLFAASWIYLMVAGVFFLRIIMIWILVILSPIAFFSYIFKDTRAGSFFPGLLSWKNWWEEFIKWVIVGIPFAFFIYIARGMIGYSGLEKFEVDGLTLDTLGDNLTEINESFDPVNIITFLMGQITSLVILYKGYKISTKNAPGAAKKFIQTSEKIVKTAVVAAATGGAGSIVGAAGGALGSTATKLGSVAAKGGVGGNLAKVGSAIARKGQGAIYKSTGFDPSKVLPKNSKHWNKKDYSNWINMKKDPEDKMAAVREAGKNDMEIDPETRGNLAEDIKQWAENPYFMQNNPDFFKKYQKEAKEITNKELGIDEMSKELYIALSDNPEKAKQEIPKKVAELQKEIDSNDELKVSLGSKVNDKEAMEKLATQTLILSDPKREIRNKEEATSLASKLSINKQRLEKIRDKFGEETAREIMKGPAGINTRYRDYKKLAKEDWNLASLLLSSLDGITYDYAPRTEIGKDKRDKNGKVNMSKVYQQVKLNELKKKVDPNRIEVPAGMEIKEEEIEEVSKIFLNELNNNTNHPFHEEKESLEKQIKTIGGEKEQIDITSFIKTKAKKAIINLKKGLPEEKIEELKSINPSSPLAYFARDVIKNNKKIEKEDFNSVIEEIKIISSMLKSQPGNKEMELLLKKEKSQLRNMIKTQEEINQSIEMINKGQLPSLGNQGIPSIEEIKIDKIEDPVTENIFEEIKNKKKEIKRKIVPDYEFMASLKEEAGESYRKAIHEYNEFTEEVNNEIQRIERLKSNSQTEEKELHQAIIELKEKYNELASSQDKIKKTTETLTKEALKEIEKET